MRTLLYILQKEFLQIFRNRAMLPIIFVMPVIQLIILGNAATFEVRQIEVSVVDMDRSGTSRLLVQQDRGVRVLQDRGAARQRALRR